MRNRKCPFYPGFQSKRSHPTRAARVGTPAWAEISQRFQRYSLIVVLLRNSGDFDKRTHGRNHHVFDHIYAAREGGFVILVRLFFGVIPNLAVGTVAVPAKIAVGNRLQRKILKAAKQPVFLGYLNLLAQHLNRHQSFVGVEQIVFHRRGQ